MHHIARFFKSGTPIYSSEVPDTTGRKTRRRKRRAQAIAKSFAFHVDLITRVTTIRKYICTDKAKALCNAFISSQLSCAIKLHVCGEVVNLGSC